MPDLTRYARFGWTVEDVKYFKPDWSVSKCEDFLIDNEKTLRNSLIERGFEIIEELASTYEEGVTDANV